MIVKKIKEKFPKDEEQFFVANFYCYMNYNKNDFVVVFEELTNFLFLSFYFGRVLIL
jgi:hypothetical protein